MFDQAQVKAQGHLLRRLRGQQDGIHTATLVPIGFTCNQTRARTIIILDAGPPLSPKAFHNYYVVYHIFQLWMSVIYDFNSRNINIIIFTSGLLIL